MKIVAIADTHNKHAALNGFMPEGDVLVHAGDLTMGGTLAEIQTALDWLNRQEYKHVIVIAGNHDFAFEHDYKKAELDFGQIIYLENNGIEIDGVRFWGSPVTPTFFNWAFNVDRGDPIKKVWDEIPDNTDVLITHGPPMGILDMTPRHENVGCYDLAAKVMHIKPELHIFGHIHYDAGIMIKDGVNYVNAAIVNEQYMPVNTPTVFILEEEENETLLLEK